MRTLTSTNARLAILSTTALFAAMGLGCSAAPDDPSEQEADGPEPVGQSDEAVSPGTVGQAVSSSCSTASVKGLSLQIIAEGNCISPGAFAKVPALSNLSVGSAVFRYLEQPARDRLVATLKAHPGTHMTVNSMLRTIAQQYLLYRWYKTGRCGIGLAASPGHSNHETGLAMDINPAGTWRTSLANHGFKWFGSADPVHFDYVGTGAVSHKGLDVKAFQRLWNRNHPGDKITVDGDWGPQTEARMKKAPAGGFKTGALCGSSPAYDVATCPHDACDVGAPMGLCSTCALDVCAADAHCCQSAWDEACVQRASELCPAEACDASAVEAVPETTALAPADDADEPGAVDPEPGIELAPQP